VKILREGGWEIKARRPGGPEKSVSIIRLHLDKREGGSPETKGTIKRQMRPRGKKQARKKKKKRVDFA